MHASGRAVKGDVWGRLDACALITRLDSVSRGLISKMTTEDTNMTELLARLDRLLSDYGLTGKTTQKDKS